MILQQRATCCRLFFEQTPAHRSYLPDSIPEEMFCFCFQSPSLKLQALEGDLGPSEAPVDPKARDYLPAQQQPLPAEEKSLDMSHKLLLHLPPSPPAQDRQTVDLSQPGKTPIILWCSGMMIKY